MELQFPIKPIAEGTHVPPPSANQWGISERAESGFAQSPALYNTTASILTIQTKILLKI
jgi:hypothetical protein